MSLAAVKGFRDSLPVDARVLARVEEAAISVLERYGFGEIRLPILEKTELFARSIGESTDVVEKEMYTFPDRDGSSLTLRPEGTASVVRAYVEHHLDQTDSVTRLYYRGAMFRHERPQKGRYRQFYQIGAEVFGRADAFVDADTIACVADLLAEIGIPESTVLLNSLGDPACRPAYRERLYAFGKDLGDALCEKCRGRLERNPLRILDCKNEGCRQATSDAPALTDHLCGECEDHYGRVRGLLDAAGVAYVHEPRLVRGLDYYMRTTFEITAPGLGAQAAVGGGGRYDGLVAALDGPKVPGIGFAMGLDRLVLALEAARPETADETATELAPEVFVAPLSDAGQALGLELARKLRGAGLRVELDGGRSLKSLMRRADKRGAPRVVILGDDEVAARKGTVRDMREKKDARLAVDLDLDGAGLCTALGVSR